MAVDSHWSRAVFFFFPVDNSGIKAIKIKLAETLAIIENWILTKPFICHICCMWSQLYQCDVQFNRLCRWGGFLFSADTKWMCTRWSSRGLALKTCSCLCLHAVFALEFLPRSPSHGSSLQLLTEHRSNISNVRTIMNFSCHCRWVWTRNQSASRSAGWL